MKLLIEPHYLGSLEYFSLIQQYDQIEFEVCDSFQKQTYRNRASVLGANKVLNLIVPVVYSNHMPTKDVKIDYTQRWLKDHWGAIYSSYGKAPFFEYFAEDFHAIWEKDSAFLFDLNSEMMNYVFRLLGWKKEIGFTSEYESESSETNDYRDVIQPKKDFSDRKIYKPASYNQLFGNTFVSNLSIIDLIMCEGPRASEILALSFRGNSD